LGALCSSPPPTGISITSSEPRIALNGSCELTATVENYPYADQTTDAAVVEVTNGVATLKGYGKAAVTATSTDSSGVVGYYYVEVAPTNPYDKFSDLEAELDVFYLTPSNSGHSNGTTTTTKNFRALRP
jgi:hypothetical protein